MSPTEISFSNDFKHPVITNETSTHVSSPSKKPASSSPAWKHTASLAVAVALPSYALSPGRLPPPCERGTPVPRSNETAEESLPRGRHANSTVASPDAHNRKSACFYQFKEDQSHVNEDVAKPQSWSARPRIQDYNLRMRSSNIATEREKTTH